MLGYIFIFFIYGQKWYANKMHCRYIYENNTKNRPHMVLAVLKLSEFDLPLWATPTTNLCIYQIWKKFVER